MVALFLLSHSFIIILKKEKEKEKKALIVHKV
jgi:hypothetical protein